MKALSMMSQKEDLVTRAVLPKSETFRKCKLDFNNSEFRFKILKINNSIQIYFFSCWESQRLHASHVS